MTDRVGMRTVVVAVATLLLVVPTTAQALWSATSNLSVQVTARTMSTVGDVTCTDRLNGVLLSWSPPDSAPSYVVRAEGGEFVTRTAETFYAIDDGTSLLDLLFGLFDPIERETTTLHVHASGYHSGSTSDRGWESPGSAVIVHSEPGLLGAGGGVRCGP